MKRNLIGYGGKPPRPQWSAKSGQPAKMVVQFVINYEEGGEHCILNGDDRSEWLLSEIVGATPYIGVRHMNMESLYEYGSRVGFWRLHRMFTERSIPCTVFAVASALAKNEDVCQAMSHSEWEIASHGLRWIDYQHMPQEEERAHIRDAVAIHTDCIGVRPLGIYQGKPSPNTRRLIVEEGGFVYDADSYADEFPYWVDVQGRHHLVVPYTLDANDMRFACAQGFNSGDQFFTYLRDAVEFLREEDQGRVLSIGLHCRLVARPGRARALQRFLDYVSSLDDIWIAKRIEIAEYWKKHHPVHIDM